MPIYEYECNACGERHEFIQKFSDGPKRKCPACGALRLKKLVSAAAFHLKGSGWYVTDFRDKDGAKKKGDDAKASEAGESKADSSESKDSKDKPKKKDDKAKTKSSEGKGSSKTKAA